MLDYPEDRCTTTYKILTGSVIPVREDRIHQTGARLRHGQSVMERVCIAFPCLDRSLQSL